MGLPHAAISGIAGAIGGSLALTLLRGFFPPAEAAPPEDIEPLRAEFSRWKRGSTAGVFAAALVTTLPLALGLRAIDALVEHGLPHATFVLAPRQLTFWSIPAGFLSLGVASGVYYAVLRRMLGARFAAFVKYCDTIDRYDTLRAARIVTPAIVALATVGAILGLDWYTYFTDSEIVVNELWSLGREHRHAYSEVASIETAPEVLAPNGNHVQRREYVIRFADGDSWNTSYAPPGTSPTPAAKLIDLVSTRSGKPVTELELLKP